MKTNQAIDERRKNLIKEAQRIGEWAKSANLLQMGQPILDTESKEQASSSLMFSAGESALADRPITALGVNPYRNSEQGGTVFIYTKKSLPKRDRNALSENYRGDAQVEFRVLKPFRAAPGKPVTNLVQKPQRVHGHIPCGSSISLAVMRDAGTLGALVQIDDLLYGLSANHVTGGCSYAPFGSPILFPGILDVGPGIEDPVTIGHHYSGLPMMLGNPQPEITVHSQQNLDAAIFSVRDPEELTSSQGGFYDTPTQIETDPNLEDMDVEKVGRATGYTEGFIESSTAGYQPLSYKLKIFVSAGEQIPFEGIVYYKQTYLVRGKQGMFAQQGDSGAIVVSKPNENEQRKAVGLVIGGEGDVTLMLPIKPILEEFNARLISNHNL